MNVLVVCDSLTGNTQRVAQLIQQELSEQYECHVHAASPLDMTPISGYDLVFLGAYTWGKGALPFKMKAYLRHIFVEHPLKVYPQFAVFGTGDTQWGGTNLKNFCRAVNAMDHYCERYANKSLAKLKIEQSPVSKGQYQSIVDFVRQIMEGMNN